MFSHPFSYVLVATFLAAVTTMVLGVAGLGKSDKGTHDASRSTRLMALRVGLCFVLLIEIIIYILYIK
ncbi:MAG: hypothetical protein DI585_04935 [Pseudomonas fluorescens]|nr:MAG: hypothetical protein DI585_04935 [Pseudomonas fluorescens]